MTTQYDSARIVRPIKLAPFGLLALLMLFAAISANSASARILGASGHADSRPPQRPATQGVVSPGRPDVSIWCVDNVGTTVQAGVCANPTAIANIQTAINGAVAGDEIRIASHTYTASGTDVATISVPLIVTGGYAGGVSGWTTPADNADSTIFDGLGIFKSVKILGATNVTLQNLALVNGGVDNASGIVNVGATPAMDLNIRSGGTSNGIFTISSQTSFVNFTTGTHNLQTGTTFTGAGFMRVNGGNVTAQGNLTVQNMQIEGGTLGGDAPSAVYVSGMFNWSGGTVSSTTNAGTITITSGAELHLNGASAFKVLSRRLMTNNGTVYVDGSGTGAFRIGNGAIFTNTVGSGTNNFLINNDESVVFDTGAGSTFYNYGRIVKQFGSGTSSLGSGFLRVVNNGSITANSGTLSLDGDATNSINEAGSYSAATPATLRFNGGNRSMGPTSTVSGLGTVEFAAGTVTIGGVFNVTGLTRILNGASLVLNGPNPTFGNLLIANGGNLSGSSTITVSDTWHWQGGIIHDTAIVNNGTLHIDGTQTIKILTNASITNNAQAHLDGTGVGSFKIGNNGAFNNQQGATFDIDSGESILFDTGAQSRFVNRGSLRKTINRATSILGQSFLAFDNYAPGVVEVMTGTLSLEGGTAPTADGGHTGTFQVDDLAGLRFNSTNHTDLIKTGSHIQGTGVAIFNSGTATIVGTYDLTGTGGTYVTGGTVNFDSNATSTNITVTAGILSSNFAPTFTVAGVFKWSGGTISGGGTMSLLSTSQLHFDGLNGATRTLRDRLFIHRGSAVVETTGAGSIRIGNGAVFSNTVGATFNIDRNDNIVFDTGTSAFFANAGTISKSGGGILGVSQLGQGNLAFNNYGTVNVLTGTLSLDGGTYGPTGDGHTRDFFVASLCTLRFNGGSHSLQTGSSITGPGNVEVASGTVDHSGFYNISGQTKISGGIFNINDRATSTEALMTGGTLGGFGAITITNVLTWTGGSMVSTLIQPGRRLTYIAPGATVHLGGTGQNKFLKDNRAFENHGTFYVDGTNTSQFRIGNGATFNNMGDATFDIQNNDSIVFDTGSVATFNNNGMLLKSRGGPAGVSQLGTNNLVFNNSGTVNVLTATLSLDGGTSGAGSTGAFLISHPEATLRFNGGSHSLGSESSISGVGTVEARSGSVTTAGSFLITGETKITGGTLSFGGSATTVDATMTSGTLTGGGVFTATGTFAWSGGTMSGLGHTRIPEGAFLTMGDSTAARDLVQRTVDNLGNALMLGTANSGFSMGNGAVFNNSVTATFTIQNNGGVSQSTGPAAPVFNNSALFLRVSSNGSANVGTGALVFNNTGTVDVQSGVVNFGSSYRQQGSGAVLNLNGGSVSNPAALQVDDGSITGSGVITGSVTNNGGTLSPGGVNFPNTITVNGAYTQGRNGKLHIEIGGLTPGLDTDKLAITGAANLSGTLQARAINGFVPSDGTSLRVMTYASRTAGSQFSNVDGYLGGSTGRYASPVYTNTSMSLVISSGPVPTTTPTPSGGTPTATRTGTPPTNTPTATQGQTTATPTACPMTFSDVNPSDYFYESVRYLYCRGVISGYGDNTFRPFNNTTRGQLAKIVVLAEGWTLTCTTQHFVDVPPDHPFYCYVETAVSHGIISGYSDGTYRPGNNVTRGQLSKIVVLAEGWTLVCPQPGHFVDVAPENPFFCQIETAFSHGIISGYADGTFRPGNNATRGQISKIVYQAITQP